MRSNKRKHRDVDKEIAVKLLDPNTSWADKIKLTRQREARKIVRNIRGEKR